MKSLFYFRLAAGSMRKNSRLYLPYHLTCIGVAAMFYIIISLSYMPETGALPGGGTLTVILRLGAFVIGAFSLLFLFYTSSFLARRRNKEFGLYNVFGLDKTGIVRILFCETLMTAASTIVCGLLLGVLLSRLFAMGLLRIMGGEPAYELIVSGSSAAMTAGWFAAVFALMFIYSACRIGASSAIGLLRSESAGEKPPRSNLLLALLGIVLLGAAYYLAVSTESPIDAILAFFAAVLMVIAATYLLFISGSVTVCRALKRNRRFYYTPRHFVPVSSMVYRMKRNGAGLASICILATMVLVMVSSTTCLYSGAEDSIRSKYPRNIWVSAVLERSGADDDAIGGISKELEQISETFPAKREGLLDYRCLSVTGALYAGNVDTLAGAAAEFGTADYDMLIDLHVLPLCDYESLTGSEVTLGENEALIFCRGIDYNADGFSVNGGKSYAVTQIRDGFPIPASGDAGILPEVYAVLPGLDDMAALIGSGENDDSRLVWNYAFDTDLDDSQQSELTSQLRDRMSSFCAEHPELVRSYSAECESDSREDFYGTYGGLFFLGIVLSMVFILAAVLIIYYKQVCEGYEDQRRFEIMRKIGMTDGDIRRSINSQLLMVFFLPLAMAGLHLGFAFPIVRRLLLLFSLNNVPLLIETTCASFAVFALLYTLVYRITSNTYYSIVTVSDKTA